MSKMKRSSYNSLSSSGAAQFSISSTSNATNSKFVETIVLSDDLQKIGFDDAKYSIFDVANWFLGKESMTHKKLQKLCYYAQAWFFAIENKKLSDTVFEAWIHGPVSPALYDKFKSFGFSPIKIVGEYSSNILDEDLELLDSVWQTYGDRTGNALESLSHSEPPWIEARRGYAPNERCGIAISPESMKEYYQSIYNIGESK